MKHGYPRSRLFAVVLLGAALMFGPVHAAQAPGESKPSEGASEDTAGTAQEKAAGKAKDKKKDGKDGGIFIPSEEISEDFAVSFPVDI